MLAWIIALGAGLLFAALQYTRRFGRDGIQAAVPAALRAAAVTVLFALLLDAPAGREDTPPPLVALDASLSWTRGDSTRWPSALSQARALGGDSVLLTGDSLRLAGDVAEPRDFTSRIGPLVEQAAAQGRPLVVFTDGGIDVRDTSAAAALPRGSRIEVPSLPPHVDAALTALMAPRSVAAGDTLRVTATVRTGSLPIPAATVALTLDGAALATVTLPALPPNSARDVVLPARVDGSDGTRVLRATVTAAGDVERRNDSMGAAVEVSSAGGAVWVSSAPDLDGREALAVLRGTLGEATRGFLQVAPRIWRMDGSLAPVSEATVRQAVADAPILVIHGDTAVFGPPRQLAGDAPLALLPGPAPAPTSAEASVLDEWYPTAAPPSPAAAALAGVPWDSLPPVSLGGASELPPPNGANAWVAVEGRRGRRGDARAFLVGSESPRRVVVQRARGLWRWRTRGGPGAIAYEGLWGSVFDWMADGRRDRRAAMPERASVRAGEPIVWRLAAGNDSSTEIRLVRRGDTAGVQVLSLVPRPRSMFAESPALPAGTYDVQAPGGTSVLVVNAAEELLPRAPTVRAGRIGTGAVVGRAPALRDYGLAYALIVVLLCAEWVLRRQRGLA